MITILGFIKYKKNAVNGANVQTFRSSFDAILNF